MSKFTDEQIEKLRKIGDLAYMEQRTIAAPTRAIAEHVAAPLEARITELERQIELAQRLHAVEIRAKDARIAALTLAREDKDDDEEEPKTAPCPFCGHDALHYEDGEVLCIRNPRCEAFPRIAKPPEGR